MDRLRSQGCKLDIPQGCLKGELHGCDSSTILNNFSWPAQRAYAMEGIRNPAKTFVYWIPCCNGMTTTGLMQRFHNCCNKPVMLVDIRRGLSMAVVQRMMICPGDRMVGTA